MSLPVSLHWLPNALCVLRMLLAPLLAWLLVRGEFGATLAVFFAAAVSDALDGFLAKRFHWTSELGKNLDPLADKILLVTVFITLALLGRIPTWLMLLVVTRDVVIAAGAIAFRLLYGPINGAPTFVSKLNTLVQILYVLAVIATAAEFLPDNGIVTALGWLTVTTTVVSGGDYVLTYARRAMTAGNRRRSTT